MSAINRTNNPIVYNFSGTATTPSQSAYTGKTPLSELIAKSNTNFTNIFLRVTGDTTIISSVTHGIYQDVVELYKNGGTLPDGWKIMYNNQEVDWDEGMSDFAYSALASDLITTSSCEFTTDTEKTAYNADSPTRLTFEFSDPSTMTTITSFEQIWYDTVGVAHSLEFRDFVGEILRLKTADNHNPYLTLTNNGSPSYPNDTYLMESDYYKFLNMNPEVVSSTSTGYIARVYFPLRPEEERNIETDYVPYIMFSLDQAGSTVTTRFCETHYDANGESGRKAYVSFEINRQDIGTIPCIQLIRVKTPN